MEPQPSRSAKVVLFPEPPRLQRARGSVRLGFVPRGGRTALADLYQSGCAKARLPRCAADEVREAVLINTAGGLTDGDRLRSEVTWGPESRAVVTTQAAERIYRSRRGPAEVTTQLRAHAGSTALWLPQETILFDRANLLRETEVEIEETARLIACESLIFGRTAMGETVTSGAVHDTWRLRIGRRLAFADCFRLHGDLAEQLDRPALGGGARAIATVICVGPDPEGLIDAVRSLDPGSGQLAASRREDVVIVRVLAGDGLKLKRSLSAVLAAVMDCLTPGLGLPRVWSL